MEPGTQHFDAIAYTTRAEGWGADIYHFGRNAICTGYSPFGTVRPDYRVNREYNEKAREVYNSDIETTEKRAKYDELIAQYIAEAIAKK